MAKIKVEKKSNYTTLSNSCLDDERLSLKAVGLLAYMLRLPDDWEFTIQWLANKHKDGEDSIRSAMKELESAGYVIRGNQHRDSRGNFKGADYIVREAPAEEEPATVSENPTRTVSENPASENPTSENPTQLNTKIPSTKKPIPPEAPQGAASENFSENTIRAKWKPERFEKFWQYFPYRHSRHDPTKRFKVKKKKAADTWDKLKPSDELIAQMGAALRRQKHSSDWLEGVGIPDPVTWLNQERWKDEFIMLDDPELPSLDEPIGDYVVNLEGLESWT